VRSARGANLSPPRCRLLEEKEEEEVGGREEDERGRSAEDSDGGGGGGGPGKVEKESRRGHSPRVPRPRVLSRVRENQSQYLRFLPTADGDHLFSGA
ncbi:hypothetical protein ALC56_12125, partial [Trachymyrmex septentrionalis]